MLYKKVTPKLLHEYITDLHTEKILKKLSASDGYALLLEGVYGAGKTNLAQLLAAAVNCSKFALKYEICGQCPSCKNKRDTEYVNCAQVTLSNEYARNLRVRSSYFPNYRKRVLILDEFHKWKINTDKLHNFLDELPNHYIVIATTNNVDGLDQATLSRFDRVELCSSECQRRKIIKAALSKTGGTASKKQIEKIAAISISPRDALIMIEKYLP